jgi:D12 class N6 adenine-specific DNA methyltransferase
MFYYFGRKKALARSYPLPAHDTIVEPFCGSAAYSLHADHWQKDIWINDLDPRIAALWHYLQAASSADIEALPALEPGAKLSSVKGLTDEEHLLISLHIGPGKNKSNDVVSKFSRWPAGQRYIAANLYKIKHWHVTNLDYAALVNVEATWFIDPPYQRSGRLYRCRVDDYDALRTWALARHGQVIVCEQQGADWLPFAPLTSMKIAGHHVSHEVVWRREDLADAERLVAWGVTS